MKKILMGYDFKREGFEILQDKFDIIYPDKQHFTKEEIISKIEDVDVLVPNFSFQTDADVINAGKNLKLIANYGVGCDNIDVAYANEKGLTVTNTPNSVLEPTAELCFALLMATARRIGYYNNKIHAGERIGWGLFEDLSLPIYGQTLGIYGMGRIGQAVARRAVASGMKVIYCNRNRLEQQIEDRYDAKYVDFDTLLSQSDFVSLNAPATAETYRLIGEEEFKKMKSSAILINTARGKLVDEKALINAIRNKDIFGAGLDVYENEPKISSELCQLENVVMTPHAGTKTYAGRLEMQEEVAHNIINFFEGGPISRF